MNRLQDTYGSRMKFVSGAGRDGFHAVPDSKGKDGDAVERVPPNVSFVRIICEPTTLEAVGKTLLSEDELHESLTLSAIFE